MTKRELENIIRINRFDNIVLKDIQEGNIIIPKRTKLIIGAIKYINRMLQYEGIDKEYLVNPRFAIGRKEYQF